jgi:O-antigen ligase
MTTSAVALASTFRVAQSREVWAGRVATGWAVLMLATELKVSLPYVHWIVSALALGVLWPYLVETKCAQNFPAQVPARLFVAAICLPAIYGSPALYSLAEAAKLAIILLGATAIFVSRSRLALHAFRGFIIAVAINFILLMGGYFGLGTAEEMAANRWGTLISWPGSLSRVAGSVWVYAAYLVIKRRSPSALALLAASTFLVYVDGSRTVLLLLLLGAVFVVIVLAAEAGQLRRSLLRFLFIATIGFGVLLMAIQYSGVLSGETTVEDQGAIGRFRLLVNTFEASGVDNLGSADVVRYQMLQDVFEAIRAHPILGTGIETTVTETKAGPMGTHMTYLQVWADLGLVGFLSYIWLVWGWVPWVPRVLRRVRTLPDPVERAIYYNALYVLLFFAAAGFFNPLSTEWSEWVLFIVAYALVWRMARPLESGERAGPRSMFPRIPIGAV